MPNRPFNIDKYSSLMKSEVTKLTMLLIALFILFACAMILAVSQIKKRNKKVAYVQLALAVILFSFLLVSLMGQIGSFNKDITNSAYIRYEGPANIRMKKQLIFGGINSAYAEYIISFEYQGVQYELTLNKNGGLSGDIDNLYIVFSEHSKYVLEMEE